MELTADEYANHCESNDGYCCKCRDITRYGDTEPDACRYECPDCADHTCFGIEEALMMGLIEITD